MELIVIYYVNKYSIFHPYQGNCMSDYAILKAELQKSDLVNLSDEAAANKLNTDPGKTVHDPITITQLGSVLSAASAIKVMQWVNFPQMRADMIAGDINSLNTWVTVLSPNVLNCVTNSEVTTMRNRLSQTKNLSTRAMELAGWNRPVSVLDVTTARNT